MQESRCELVYVCRWSLRAATWGRSPTPTALASRFTRHPRRDQVRTGMGDGGAWKGVPMRGVRNWTEVSRRMTGIRALSREWGGGLCESLGILPSPPKLRCNAWYRRGWGENRPGGSEEGENRALGRGSADLPCPADQVQFCA